MSAGVTELSICLHGSPPYGFRIAGADGEPVTVARVRHGSKAEQAGLIEGDVVLVVNDVICRNLTYDSVFGLTEYDEDQLSLTILRGRDNIHVWKEACDRLKGRKRMLDDEQVKDMLSNKSSSVKKFERGFGNPVFQLQMPRKKSPVSSFPVSVIVDGEKARVESRSSEIINQPLRMEDHQKVFMREVNPFDVVKKENRYSYSYSSSDLTSNNDASYNTLPKITHTFVSQNNLRIGDSLADKIESAMNPSVFFESPHKFSFKHEDGRFQTDFKVTPNQLNDDSKYTKVPYNTEANASIVKEHIIQVVQEPANISSKYQSFAKLNMNAPSPQPIHNPPVQKPQEGFLIKQNDKPIKKSQEESIDFPSTKIFSDYLPQSFPTPKVIFKKDTPLSPSKSPQQLLSKSPPKPSTDYPFMNFSGDFQDKKVIEEPENLEHSTPLYAAPVQHHAQYSNGYEATSHMPFNHHESPLSHSPKPFLSPQMEQQAGKNVGGTVKDAMNAKVALAKNVALSVLSEANQNSKGQKMFLKKRQNSEKWTIHGPEPSKPPPAAYPTQQLHDQLSKSTQNLNLVDSPAYLKNAKEEKFQDATNGVTDHPSHHPPHHHPSYPVQPHFNQYPGFSYPPQQSHIGPHQLHYESHHPWSPPSFPYHPSYPQHFGTVPPNHFPYHPSQHYQPQYQPSQPYQHPYGAPYSSPYYPPFSQNQPQVHPYPPTNPHHQPSASHYPSNTPNHHPANSYTPQAPSYPLQPSFPPQAPSSHLTHSSAAPQDVVDYCDL